MKKIEKEPKIKEIPSPPKSIAPIFTNIVTGYSHEEMVVLDFGFFAPSYIEDADYLEDSQVARLCLPWSTAEDLHELLSDILKTQPPKRNKRKPRTHRS
jgi:hypothetical protein